MVEIGSKVTAIEVKSGSNFTTTSLDKLKEKYGKNIDLAKAKANSPDKEVTVVNIDAVKDIADFIGARTSEYEFISKSGKKDEFDTKKDQIKTQLEKLTNEETFKAVFPKKKISELTDNDVKDKPAEKKTATQKTAEKKTAAKKPAAKKTAAKK